MRFHGLVLCMLGARRGFTSGDLIRVPQSGEKNTTFGIYESVCCGLEIVIRAGAEFPTCSDHPNLKTAWQQIEILDSTPLPAKWKSEPAA